MPERLEIEPAVLRQLANQHDQVARDTREWARPPYEWLANFEPTYGKIANPVKVALEKYYDARQRAGEALAREHEQTAANLRASADSYELADQSGATGISRGGDEFTDTPGPVPNTPVSTTMNQPVGAPGDNTLGSRAPGLDGTAVPDGATPAGVAPGSGSAQPTAANGAGAPTAPLGSVADTSGANNTTSPAAPSAAAAAAATAPPGTTAPVGGLPPVGAGGLPGGSLGVPGAGDDRPAGRAATAAGDGMPMPAATTPFGSAVNAAKDRAAEPDYVVAEEVSEDLIIARTLLGAVLAAVESSVGTAWAVSVMRGPAGAGIFITSNEGRGWLPAGLYLPREVSTPWLWDELLRTEDSPGSPWEGVSDPARILVEFGLAWGGKANATLAALVSSGPIDPGLRAHLADVPMEGMVGPSYDVDLRVFTPDTVDRLGLTGSVPAIEAVAALPDAQIRARCLELAVDAQTQLVRSVAAPAESVGVRSVRDRILARLQDGGEVPREWWSELRDADDLIAAAMISRRVDVGRVSLGDLRVDDEAAILRTLAWERRCNELLLALEQEDDSRQVLRDAVYAHEQVVQHPAFTAAPAPVSVGTEERIDAPVASGTVSAPDNAVSAPVITPGPPSGVMAPLSTRPDGSGPA
ncbi:type VII secretion target [Nocardia carnea]|uniref:type VII secretion target n=1 Tax=Nocardia carnea TaxID=37328 RepID=UPI00245783C3|nr:type VII secretion target [Nocardia carnea]